MEVFLCTMLFIMGTFFGSFFTLAVYRIPLGKDITHEHSFCPNCNHLLGVLDLIPVWSYIILGGKCRYCGQKIRIRYLFLEILSGIVFVVAWMILKNITYFVGFVGVYVTLVLLIGIWKDYKKINKGVLLFGIIWIVLYMMYLCILGV